MGKHKKRRSRSPERKKRSRSRDRHRKLRSQSPKHKRKSRSRTRSPRPKHRSPQHYCIVPSTSTLQSKQSKVFSLEDYKRELDQLFFSDRDVIIKGTPQYDEFWSFFQKYQAMKKRQGITNWTPPSSEPKNELGVPITYHRAFLLNFTLNLPHPDKLLSRLPPEDIDRQSSRPKLTRENLMEFHQIIQLYLEFLQREKITKLKKLRESQEKLPIAQYKNDIIKAVADNQVIIIAGQFPQKLCFEVSLMDICF